jgi:hypothetical protein
MSNRALQRLGAASGVAYVVLLMVGSGILNSGEEPVTLEARAHLLADAAVRTPSIIGISLELLGFLCFLGFLGSLWSALHRAEGEHGWLAAAALGGGLVSLTIKLASAVPLFAALFGVRHGLDHQFAQTLDDIAEATYYLSLPPLAVLLLASAGLAIGGAALPRWLGWSAVVLAVALLGGATAGLLYGVGDEAGLPFLLFLLWALLTSIVLIRRAGTAVRDGVPTERIVAPIQ